jgi:hypothetical protein
MSRKKEDFEKYKQLVAARNFHYENFNKWLTYFYVANAAIFVGYIQILISAKHGIQQYEIPILIFGYLSGLLLYWSSKGYYYWNLNFILLVNHYEETILKWKRKERIYSMFADKDAKNKRINNFFSPFHGANFSTSKIAILFAYIIATTWGAILLFSTICLTSQFEYLSTSFGIIMSILVSGGFTIGITSLFGVRKKHFLWSNTTLLHNLKSAD